MQITKEKLLSRATARLERMQEAMREHSGSPDACMDLRLAEIALASLEAEPVAYMWDSDRKDVDAAGYYRPEHKIFAESSVKRYGGKVVALFTAPPAPVSAPDVLKRLRSIVADPRALPRRKEWISGQQYSYVLLENVEAMVDDACRAAMLQGADGKSPVIQDGYVLVPVEPTEDMIIHGFESEPDESFSDEKEWEAYEAMSGCQQAAHRAKLCWAAMIAAAPKQCSDKSTKPVADLYAIKVPGCRALKYTTHAGEAESCASEGWLVQEYVKVERLQRPADNGGDSYALMDGLAFYSDKEEEQ